MKSAEKWIKPLLQADISKGVNHPYFDIIKQIQLDAIKEGLLQAAKIAENTCGKGYKFSEFNRGALSVKQNILAQTHHENHDQKK